MELLYYTYAQTRHIPVWGISEAFKHLFTSIEMGPKGELALKSRGIA